MQPGRLRIAMVHGDPDGNVFRRTPGTFDEDLEVPILADDGRGIALAVGTQYCRTMGKSAPRRTE
jgi:hypothetical protein